MADRSVSNSISFHIEAGAHGEANWSPHGQGYRVTLIRKVNGKRRQAAFDFWDSVANAQKGAPAPKKMEVLECWLSDAISGMEYEDDFAGFCREFGYDFEDALEYERGYRKDSRPRIAWKGCIKSWHACKRLDFNPGEMWNNEFAGDNYPTDDELAA